MSLFDPTDAVWPVTSWSDWLKAAGVDLAEGLRTAENSPGPRVLRVEPVRWRLVGYDELPVHEVEVEASCWSFQGDNPAGEIAFALAELVRQWRLLPDATLAPPSARVSLGSGTHVVAEIAKLRAFRLLAASLVHHLGYGMPTLRVKVSVHPVTGNDPANALVRATVQALAGVIGLADELEIDTESFTALGPSGDSAQAQAQRLALAIGHILREEAGLASIADPAAGSYAVESQTWHTARLAWSKFQALDADNGQGDLAVAYATERAAIPAGKPKVIVGSTHFTRNPSTMPV